MCLTLKLTYQQDKYLSSLYRTRKLKKALKEYIKVAKVDIHVYKQVDISPLGHICAPYRNCIYDGPLISIEEGSTIKIRASGSDDWLNFTVNQGIHAYTKIRSYNTRIYIPCVIPKGTKYVIGEKHQIVADCLIMTGAPFKAWYPGEGNSFRKASLNWPK